MTLEDRITALIAQYRAEAQKLELEGIAARRLLVRDALQAEAVRFRAVAADLAAQLIADSFEIWDGATWVRPDVGPVDVVEIKR